MKGTDFNMTLFNTCQVRRDQATAPTCEAEGMPSSSQRTAVTHSHLTAEMGGAFHSVGMNRLSTP